MFRRLLVGSAFLLGMAILAQPSAGQGEKPKPPPEKTTSAFEVRIIRVGESYQAIRFKVKSGESWYANGGQWAKIADPEKIPAGSYEVLLVATEKDFSAMRFDRVTGTSWLLRGGDKWVKMTEPD
jgi:hypothetical protein